MKDYPWSICITAQEIDEKNKGNDEVLAFQMGNDIIISAEDVGPAIRKIKRLIKKERKFWRRC